MFMYAADAAEIHQPSVDERIKISDLYFAPRILDMVSNLDIHAHFVADDRGVLFERESAGIKHLVYADILHKTQTELVAKAEIVKLLHDQKPVDLSPFLDVGSMYYNPEQRILDFKIKKNFWRYRIQTADLVQLPATPDGVLSPDRRLSLTVRDHDLWLIDRVGQRNIRLTTDGTANSRYAQRMEKLGELVKADVEPIDIPVDALWSADGKHILTYRMDMNGAKIWHTIQSHPQGSAGPRTFDYIYPSAGEKKLPLTQLLVIDVETTLRDGRAHIMPVKAMPEEVVFTVGPKWFGRGNRFFYQWSDRGYGTLKLLEIDPVTGSVKVRVTEALKPNVTVTATEFRPLPEFGGSLIVSERSGWAQLYFVPDGEPPQQGRWLTKGAWEVVQINHVSPAGAIVLTGTGREPGINPYNRNLYRIKIDGVNMRRLTPEPLDHQVTVSHNGLWFLDKMSSATVPTRTVLRRTSDGSIIMELAKADPSALLATGFIPPEPVVMAGADGKTKLYGMVYKPRYYASSQHYPIIDNVYTAPTGHLTPTTYEDALNTQASFMAQMGVIVVIIDGRGTSGRGKMFRNFSFRNLTEAGIDDHIAVLRGLQNHYPTMDLTRVGVYGGSAGGYDAARFLLRRPDFFKVAVASAGNHDLRLDKAWWPEVSMGVADDATWERNSNISLAGKLQGKLMLVHGELDDNVPIDASTAFAAALKQAGKPFEFLIVPDGGHGRFGIDVWQQMRGFFVRELMSDAVLHSDK